MEQVENNPLLADYVIDKPQAYTPEIIAKAKETKARTAGEPVESTEEIYEKIFGEAPAAASSITQGPAGQSAANGPSEEAMGKEHGAKAPTPNEELFRIERQVPAAPIEANAGVEQVAAAKLLRGFEPEAEKPVLPFAEADKVIKEITTSKTPQQVGAPSGIQEEGFSISEPGPEFTGWVEMPELVKLARMFVGGKFPIIKKMYNYGLFSYKPGGEAISINLDPQIFKNPYMAAKVLAHEIGHANDFMDEGLIKGRGNLAGHIAGLRGFMRNVWGNLNNKELRAELIALSEHWRPYDKSKVSKGYIEKRQSASELYADSLSVYFCEPELLMKMAPKFYAGFLENLDSRPAAKKILMELLDFLAAGDEAIHSGRLEDMKNGYARARARAAELRNENKRSNVSLYVRVWAAFKSRSAWFRDKVLKLAAQGIRINPDDNPVYAFEEYDQVEGKVADLMIEYDKEITFPMVKQGISLDDFGIYLELNRDIHERTKIANPFGHTEATAKETMERFLKDLGTERAEAIKKYAKKFYSITKDLVDQAFAVGLYDMSRETTDAEGNKITWYEHLMKNPAYATFQVVDHMESSDYVAAGIRAQTGTFKEIRNPYVTTMLKNRSILKAIERIKTADTAIKFIKDYFPEDWEEAQFTGDMYNRRIKDKAGFGVLKTMKNGRVEGVYVDQIIAVSMERFGTKYNNLVLKALKALNHRWFRPLFVVWNLTFQSKNLWRDFQRGWKLNGDRNLAEYITSFFKRIGSYVKAIPIAKSRFASRTPAARNRADAGASLPAQPDEMIREMMRVGAFGNITFNDIISGKSAEDIANEGLARELGYLPADDKKGIVAGVKGILGAIEHLGNIIETLPKVVAFMDHKAQARFAMAEIGHDTRNYAGSPNFAERGTETYWTNELLLFSNPMIQGIGADIDGAFLNPRTRAGYWWKTVMVDFIPKILMFLLAAGLLGKKRKKMMDKISEYNKTNYTCVPLGLTKNGQCIYLRIPPTQESGTFGGILWKLLGTQKKGILGAMAQIPSYVIGQLPGAAPLAEIVFNTFIYATGGTPYDFYRNRPLFTDDERKAGGMVAAKKFGKWAISNVGFTWSYYFEKDDTTITRVAKCTPIVRSWIKISSYGEEEEQRAKRAEFAKKKAKRKMEMWERRKR